jgi:hypothetical protein
MKLMIAQFISIAIWKTEEWSLTELTVARRKRCEWSGCEPTMPGIPKLMKI